MTWAIVCHALDGDDRLRFQEIDLPDPAPGMVRIETEAAGVNFADVLITSGGYQVKPPLPFCPGMEVAGRVSACGAGVSLLPGTPVVAVLPWGCHAGAVIADAACCLPLPASLSCRQAAAIPVAYGSALHALRGRGRLGKGEWLLVHGASGGAGLAAVEVGAWLGGQVIAVTGRETGIQAALDRGAAAAINYREEQIAARVMEITSGHGADVILDAVGGDAFRQSMRCIAPLGRILVFGFASGHIPTVRAGLVLVRECEITGVNWEARWRRTPGECRAELREILALVACGRLRPQAPVLRPLREGAMVLDDLRTGRLGGKAVLLPDRNNTATGTTGPSGAGPSGAGP